MPDYGSAFATVLQYVLIGIGLAVPALLTLQAWIVDETLSPGLACGILTVLFLSLFAVWASQGTGWMFLWVAIVLAGCAGLPFLVRRRNGHALQAMAAGRIDTYLRTLAQDPNNAAAHAYLGDAYLECGRFEEAIAQYREAIDLDPEHTHAERAKLRRVLESRQERSREGKRP
jgi:hypothetical protein